MAARRVRVVEKSDPIDRYVSKTKPISITWRPSSSKQERRLHAIDALIEASLA